MCLFTYRAVKSNARCELKKLKAVLLRVDHPGRMFLSLPVITGVFFFKCQSNILDVLIVLLSCVYAGLWFLLLFCVCNLCELVL